jgi:hypothetical protein
VNGAVTVIGPDEPPLRGGSAFVASVSAVDDGAAVGAGVGCADGVPGRSGRLVGSTTDAGVGDDDAAGGGGGGSGTDSVGVGVAVGVGVGVAGCVGGAGGRSLTRLVIVKPRF